MDDSTPDDGLLLRRHLDGDAAAFVELVRRHGPLVHAAARRQLGVGPEADDVAQAVFLALLRRAAALTGRPSVGGWLLRATRYAAIDSLRKGNRRRRHEAAAARPEAALADPDRDGPRLAGVIDAAMSELRAADRDVLVLRYFQDRTAAEAARRLGLSEAATQKRTTRALDRLRRRVRRRGVALPAAAVAGLVLVQARSAPAAPPASTVVGVAPSSGVSSIANGVITAMRYAKLKTAGSVATSAAVLACLGLAIGLLPPGRRATPAAAATTLPTGAVEAYLRAASLIKADSPSNGKLEDDHPPYTAAWLAEARAARQQNAAAYAALRDARNTPDGTWPTTGWPTGNWQDNANPRLQATRSLRRLANDLSDAAELAAVDGRQNDALDSLDDLGRLSDLLRLDAAAPGGAPRTLVGVGIDALRCYAVCVVVPRLNFSPGVADAVGAERIAALITSLRRPPDADRSWDAIGAAGQADAANAAEASGTPADADATRGRFRLVLKRMDAERSMLVVSMACQLFRRETSRWPNSADELVPHYLPALPPDPFATRPAPIGYQLERGGLPGGGDRPLVFDREDADDGLTFSRVTPLTSFYVGNGDPNAPSAGRRKKHGQFRDVAAWPTTRPGI